MRIRVGKNIFFKLTVNRLNDEPEDFTDARNVRLTINRKYSSYQVSPPLTIRDNIVEFEFVGGGNAISGQYEVHLYYEKLNEASVTGIDKFYLDFCNAFILVDLTCKEDTGFESESPSINLKGVIERNRDGKDGLTPSIGENGNWWIGDVDTGKPSRGKAFEYSDFTEEQIHELQEPARAMIEALDTLDKAVTANEQQRITNEVTRGSNEDAREEAENLRRETENTRASNEEARETAETGRASAEDNRVKAEQSRVEAESNRVKAETLRVEKENERQKAESTRDTNEQSRKEAETNRVKAEEGRVTEFNRLKTESETATQNATTQANYAKYQGDNVAGTVEEIKTAHSALLTRVNDYMYDVSELLGKLAYRDGVGTDLKNMIPDGYFNLKGELIEAPNTYYQYIEVDKGKCYYLKVGLGGALIYQLCLFDKEGDLIKSLRANIDGYYVFEGVAKIGISAGNRSTTQIHSYNIQDLTTVLNTEQGNRALYVAAGATYNEQSGFYELNGLTDITEEQMREIYNVYFVNFPSGATALFSNSKIRTNLPPKTNPGGWVSNLEMQYLYANCKELEVARVGATVLGYMKPNIAEGIFYNCNKLRKVIGTINLDKVSSVYGMLRGCEALETINIQKLYANFSFADSPLITLESLQYLINNAANTSPITVTVHADVYAKIQDETNAEWHALIETAAAKQITFATA